MYAIPAVDTFMVSGTCDDFCAPFPERSTEVIFSAPPGRWVSAARQRWSPLAQRRRLGDLTQAGVGAAG
jgi:hypothetical protein